MAIIALVLIAVSKPVTDYRAGPGRLSRAWPSSCAAWPSRHLGFQQSATWGWSNPATVLCIVAGVALLVCFVFVELRTSSPLMQVRIFRIRAFAVENLVLGIAMLVFVPIFFFASEYAQIALGKSAQQAGLYLLYFFLGFVVTSQIGGRILDRSGAKRPVVIGCAVAAVGFDLWAGKVTQLDFSNQVWPVILSGAGMGFMLTPANTDAVNRASRLSYGEATGITQTVRNYAASLGFAILGTILVTELRSRVTSSLIAQGVPPPRPPPRRPSSARRRTPGPAPQPSRTSSGWTSPTPPEPCSTSWPASWPRPRWWRFWVSNAACRWKPLTPARTAGASAEASTPAGPRPVGFGSPRPRRGRPRSPSGPGRRGSGGVEQGHGEQHRHRDDGDANAENGQQGGQPQQRDGAGCDGTRTAPAPLPAAP